MDGTMSEIRLFAPNFAPKYWAFCAGQILAISTNQALFSLLGTTFGGNGVTTFALPDFRGRAPMGTGTPSDGVNSYVLGMVTGSNSVTALSTNLPPHTHTATGSYSILAYGDAGDKGSPAGNILAALSGLYTDKTADVALSPVTPAVTSQLAGANTPIPVQQPYLGMNYIICLQGIYPSRN